MTHKTDFLFKKIPCLLLAFLLVIHTVTPINVLSVESESGDITGTTSKETVNSISGVLWLDTNEDGIHDASESPIVEYTVSLYAENDLDNAVQTAVTAIDGTYSFKDITPGNYVVGVVSTTIDKQEYLLPLMGIVSDNKFVIAEDWANAYSEVISIDVGCEVSGIDAGMRIPPTTQTMAEGVTYTVTSDSGRSEIYSGTASLWSVTWWINDDATNLNYITNGTTYTIVVQGSGTANGQFNLGAYTATGLSITVTSAVNTICTITADVSGWLFDMGNNSLTLENIILDGNQWTGYAGGVSMSGGIGTLTMESGSSIQNFYSNNSAVSLSDSHFNMNGGTIINNWATDTNGGGISLTNTIFTMNNGTISYNVSNNNGGGVYIENSSLFNMIGGTISNNTTSKSGGGVYLAGSTLNMSDGIISGNTANENGGGVFVSTLDSTRSIYTMTGGKIEGNKATTKSGGGVFVSYDCSFTMKEANGNVPKIINNNAHASGGGLYILYRDNSIFSMTGGEIKENKTSIADPTSLGGGIYFYIDNTATNPSPITIEAAVISKNTAYSGGGIGITNESYSNAIVQLTIKDTTIGGSTTNDKNEAKGAIVNNGGNGGGFYIGSNIQFIMESGNISYNISQDSGGGVFCEVNSSFTMNDGTISHNTTNGTGGGVSFLSGGIATFKMNGGTINDNMAGWEGGGLYIGANNDPNNDPIIIGSDSNNKVTISNNMAGHAGGGISFQWGSATLTIKDAEISNNELTYNWNGGGAGVHCGGIDEWNSNSPSLVLNNVNITGNSNTAIETEYYSNTLGSGIYFLGSGKLTISDSTISENTNANKGGGIYVGGNATAEIKEVSTISSNTSTGNGGGIYIADGGIVTINDSKITNNVAASNGGGINIEEAPNSYFNLMIDELTDFKGNVAQAAYQPPEGVRTNFKCLTINNGNYSSDTIPFELNEQSPLNNYDINLVLYRIKFTIDTSVDWSVLGNIAVTFTDNEQNITQTAIFSKNIGEYRGYPDPETDDHGIEMLPDGLWYVTLNLPRNYTYKVYFNYELRTDNYLTTTETPVKFIEIKIIKKEPLWGKWIYKFSPLTPVTP